MIPFPDISPEIFSITVAGREFALRWYALAYLVGLRGAPGRAVLDSAGAIAALLSLAPGYAPQEALALARYPSAAESPGQLLQLAMTDTLARLAVETFAALAAAPDVASVFANDRQAQKSRIGESATLTTGFLADDVGAALTEVFRNIQIYQNGGPVTVDGVTYTPSVVPPRTTAADNIDGSASDEVTAFLTKQMQMLDKAIVGVTAATARNGSMQNQVQSALAGHQAQQTSLTKMLEAKTGYDPAQAITDLQLAGVAIEASAQVIVSLKSTSARNGLPWAGCCAPLHSALRETAEGKGWAEPKDAARNCLADDQYGDPK